ncbi:MAG TPA: TraR/DksA C4-type zinc finger protein [Pseudoxanthomonas mexicana]|nr:TraR/DksA C4-type zinc finger protein [Pseudoxanthomonas mexicana]
MIDDADKAAANEERAMEIFQKSRQERYIAPPEAFPGAGINCLDCGEIIPPARLKAVPRTLRCARCAADVEGRWNN